ncbi:TBPIP-domain-containing protein [Ascobolus immersus RN42]|uniref:TBPIP-domain-containing protein n=1 Tax=Ascobolus immersus RN42 TaxID=1160509 RepID=A0A3N4I185_ASCIM|nr:TBPIP-domain-containing protein [Ascobolus immersus RN42]
MAPKKAKETTPDEAAAKKEAAAAKKQAAAAKKAAGGGSESKPTVKKETKVTVTGEEAVNTIYEYLQVQNRPYSATEIFTNLHGAVGKTHVPKHLKELVERGNVVECTSGKQVVYHIVQDTDSKYSEEELAAIRSESASLSAQLATLRSQKRELDHKLAKIRSAPPLEELQEKVEALKEEIAHREEILEPLRASANDLTDEQKEAARVLEKDRDAARALYYRRKKSYKELLGIICDGLDKSPDKLIEDLGLEEVPI